MSQFKTGVNNVLEQLEQQYQDVNRNYRTFRGAWEEAKVECQDLVTVFFDYAPGLVPEEIRLSLKEAQENRKQAFAVLERLDAESTALFEAIKAVKALQA